MRDIAKLKSEDVIRSHISYSLKNKATNWYDAELTSLEKEALRVLPLEDGWYKELIKRWKPPLAEALQKIDFTTYSWTDVRAGKEPREYAQEIVRHTRAAGRTDLYKQLLKIRENIEPSLRAVVINPTTSTTLAEFLEHLDVKFLDWQDQVQLRDRRLQTHRSQPPPRNPRTQNPRIQEGPQAPGRPQNTQFWTSHRFQANNPQSGLNTYNQQRPQNRQSWQAQPRWQNQQHRNWQQTQARDQGNLARPEQRQLPALQQGQPRTEQRQLRISDRPYYQNEEANANQVRRQT